MSGLNDSITLSILSKQEHGYLRAVVEGAKSRMNGGFKIAAHRMLNDGTELVMVNGVLLEEAVDMALADVVTRYEIGQRRNR